jgi:phthalate 4,5-dioxygenase oxygenase subunit
MKEKRSTTGISGVLNQDFAIQESMGPIYDRSQEHLGAADVAVIHMRELLLASVQQVVRGGLPVGHDKGPVPYDKLRAADAVIPLETPWQTVGALPDEQM